MSEVLRSNDTLRRTISGVFFSAVGFLILNSCSWNDLNPSGSVTHDAYGGAVDEIEANFPGAHDIKVTHSDDNPNNMSWLYTTEDGKEEYCTSIASTTHNNGATPGQIITEPYCRDASSVNND